MKVAINSCYGGFNLSREFFEVLKTKGWSDGEIKICRMGRQSFAYYDGVLSTTEFRCHPDVISTIESLGEKASGIGAKVVIVKIPDDVDFEIHETEGGQEYIAEKHRKWDINGEEF